MAKKKNSSKKKQKSSAPKDENRITLEALDVMSSSDDDDVPQGQLNAKALDLQKKISEGKFDHLIEKLKENEDNDSEIEEVSLGSDSDEEEEEGEKSSGDDDGDVQDKEEVEGEESEDDDDDDDSSGDSQEDVTKDTNEVKGGDEKASTDDDDDENSEEGSDDDEDDEEEDEEEDEELDILKQLEQKNQVNSKALSVVTAELVASHARLPWAETFDVIPSIPLPFGAKKGDEEGEAVDIHDDLKREVAFYNTALEAVNAARQRCKTFDIPFSRPEDFFAEMVKTDDHMAKVKDKLIFETKKMDAVAQRKANREQKLRAKESQANRLAEKAKRKKDHFKNVEEWANNAANNRGGALRDDLDDMFLKRAPSKKRQAADRKYGYGGKRGRFKQNDRATLNDTSGFNPRGNFPAGMKKSAKGGAGAGRQGKRARDAKRARRS